MPEITLDTTEKVFSIIAGLLAIAGALVWLLRRDHLKRSRLDDTPITPSPTSQTVTVNVDSSLGSKVGHSTLSRGNTSTDIAKLKRESRILFIDDDRGFKIVDVLKKMGWENAKLVADISSLEQPNLLAADVLFIDIQGVGRAMQYADEGLGLALAIKRRHPKKKLVIYSAEEKGARFHEALQEADYSLPKTAEPIRFEDTIIRVLTK